jgi:HTH-type transcriptional regulator/antitoxin HigA
MEQQGLTRKDLEQYIGSRARVSEVLNYKRPLSLNMIRKLNTGLGIPAKILIGDTNESLDSDSNTNF